jgi:high-affinity iron transporter
MCGILSAVLFAIFAHSITTSYEGLGDEIFNASIILFTAIVISWTVVWMQGYTKKMKQNLGKLSDKITAGIVSKFMLVIVVASAIMREGVEIILFIYSISSTANISGNDYILGLTIGAFLGFITGTVIYTGLIKYSGKYIFNISSILLTLIAAGLSSEAAGILTSAGIIEMYNTQLWDTSSFVSNQSIFGKLLNIMIGYDSRPNGMQLIFYFSTIMLTLFMMKLQSTKYGKNNV